MLLIFKRQETEEEDKFRGRETEVDCPSEAGDGLSVKEMTLEFGHSFKGKIEYWLLWL